MWDKISCSTLAVCPINTTSPFEDDILKQPALINMIIRDSRGLYPQRWPEYFLSSRGNLWSMLWRQSLDTVQSRVRSSWLLPLPLKTGEKSHYHTSVRVSNIQQKRPCHEQNNSALLATRVIKPGYDIKGCQCSSNLNQRTTRLLSRI